MTGLIFTGTRKNTQITQITQEEKNMALQVKLFTNGIKAVLREQRGNQPTVLRMFDKDGCMVAQRKILSKHYTTGERTLEKVTLKADYHDAYDIDLKKEYKAVTFDAKDKMNSFREGEGTLFDDLEIDVSRSPQLWNGLVDKEAAMFREKGHTSSDNTLFNMLKQWCDFRRVDTPRETPKPMRFKGMND